MKKVFLDDLPRGGQYISSKYINWKKSIGYKVKFIYDDIKDEVEIANYDGKFLYIKYKNDEIHKIKTGDFSKGGLGEILGLRNTKYIYKINDIVNNLKILECSRTGSGKGIYKIYKYICLNCGNVDYIRENQIINDTGCNVCCGKGGKVLRGYNDIATTHPQLVKYFANIEDGYKYSYGSSSMANFKCPDCGYIKSSRISHVSIDGLSCSKCGDGISMPNKIMFNILEQINVVFETEYSPEWCNYKYKDKIKIGKYDFYFRKDNIRYIVEMDGGFHFKDNKMTGVTAEGSKQIDGFKDKLAKDHDINVIRINCDYENKINKFDYVKVNILKSILVNLFDLSDINWNSAFLFSTSSRIKEACNLWNSGIRSTKTISQIMKLSGAGVLNYLKRGTLLQICDYNAKIARKEGNTRSVKRSKEKAKKVICLNTNHIFISRLVAGEWCNINPAGIENCIRGKAKSAGKHPDTGEPLTWMYYEHYLNLHNEAI